MCSARLDVLFRERNDLRRYRTGSWRNDALAKWPVPKYRSSVFKPLSRKARKSQEILMLWPKKILTRNLMTKKNSWGSKIPLPSPPPPPTHTPITFLMVRPLIQPSRMFSSAVISANLQQENLLGMLQSIAFRALWSEWMRWWLANQRTVAKWHPRTWQSSAKGLSLHVTPNYFTWLK